MTEQRTTDTFKLLHYSKLHTISPILLRFKKNQES